MTGNKKSFSGELMLAIAAVIWGTSFIAQRIGMDYVGPFTFTASRFTLGGLLLLVAIFILDKIHHRSFFSHEQQPLSVSKRNLLLGGISCGLALFCGASLQQIGIISTTAGKTGFITALYIVLVPLLGLFLGNRTSKTVFIGILFALPGLYLLSIKEGFSISRGDFIVLTGTIFWASHILIIDHFSPKVNGLKMSCIQFFVAATLAWIAAFITEPISLGDLKASFYVIAYAAVFAVGIAYTLQILGQRTTDPTVASIILSMEAVFAVIFGALILHETMTLREMAGCCLMFIAIIITQLPEGKKSAV